MIGVFILFLISLAVLVKGSDFFVESVARIARQLGVSDFVIGLTVVAIGTSLPELSTSIIAAVTNNPGLVVGNVVGSNIANIGLILGVSAVIATISVSRGMFHRDGLIMVGLSFAFLFMTADMRLSRLEGGILLLAFAVNTAELLRLRPRLDRYYHFKEFLAEFMKFKNIISIRFYRSMLERGISVETYKKLARKGIEFGGLSMAAIKKGVKPQTYARILLQVYSKIEVGIIRDFLIALAGVSGLYFGSHYVVLTASEIALYLGIPQSVVGFTMIAVATSLPELSVSMSSVRKGFDNLVWGNIIGSNITNLTLVAGTSALISPIQLTSVAVNQMMPLMIGFALISLAIIKSGWDIRRRGGVMLLLLYTVSVLWILI